MLRRDFVKRLGFGALGVLAWRPGVDPPPFEVGSYSKFRVLLTDSNNLDKFYSRRFLDAARVYSQAFPKLGTIPQTGKIRMRRLGVT